MRPTAFFCAAALAAAASASAQGVTFSDVTQAAGIKFKHTSGAFGKKYLPETMGAGVAFLDYDGDGWQDLLFANSKGWPGQTGPRATPGPLPQPATAPSRTSRKAMGLDVEMYGMGVAAADYDNDGRVDVYLTGVGGNRLFHNDGARFTDVTAKAGVGGGGFATSAAFFDYDRDGKLDLVVANYVEWTLEKDLYCTLDGKTKSYCTPESYKGQSADALPQPRRRHVRGRDEEGRASRARRPRRSASACWTSTATAGSTSSWPTTRSRTSSTATAATARSRTSA